MRFSDASTGTHASAITFRGRSDGGGDDDDTNNNEDDAASMISASSNAMTTIDSSNHFVCGDYEHNQDILKTLDDDAGGGVYDDDSDERFVYESTRRLSRTADRFRPIYGALVPPGDLQRSSDSLNPADRDGGGGGDNRGRPPPAAAASRARTDTIDTHRNSRSSGTATATRNFFLIFQRDDRYLKVTRDEIRRVRAMHRRFREGAEFCFNYNALLFIASLIAALGLGSDSVATIIASMLVSPLMGPVMGMAYAATILDAKLFKDALRTELVSLAVCIAAGSIVAACLIPFQKIPRTWPKNEMMSRTETFNLLVGIPTAFASGLGVAVSVLDDQTSSLVGVAISASLLPPAVNAGMLWTTGLFLGPGTREANDLAVGGVVSMALALVNIGLIIVSSMLMFRVKERMPIKNKKIFWTDLGLARKIYRNLAYNDHDETETEQEHRSERSGKIGRQFAFFLSNPFFSSSKSNVYNDDDDDEAPNRRRPSNITTTSADSAKQEIRLGLEDIAQRPLATVIEEERLTGYSSA